MISLQQCGAIHDIGHDVRWSRPAFALQVGRRAALLSQMNIGRGSIVAIFHGGSANFFADLLATWMVGATAACLDPTLTDAEVLTLIEFAKPAVLLVDRATPAAKLSIPIVDLDHAADADFADATKHFVPDDPALILFTSGTTGSPKGVVLSFRALMARISSNIAVLGKQTIGRTLVALPTHFGHGLIGNSLTAFLNGGEIVLHPLGTSLASNLGRIIDDYRISFMSSVPALWHLAKSHSSPPAQSSLVRVHVGSAPLSAQLWTDIEAWSRAEVVNCYGLTETANWVGGASSKMDGIAEGLLGKPWGARVGVIADDGSIRSAGRGELAVQSAALMSGYFNRPDLTAAVLVDGWFHTGDRGSVDEDGRIWLTGRIKDEINRGGMKIQPAEIDALLQRHPAVAEACTFGIPDPVSREAVAALVKFRKGASVGPESLQAWCRERLRPFAIPERWIVVDEIPKNARGKINRAALRRMYSDDGYVLTSESAGTGDRGAAQSHSGESDQLNADHQIEIRSRDAASVRQAVERAWIAILGKSTFAADQPWVDAGGDSLGLLRLWFRVEKTLGNELPMDGIHQNMKPSEIVAAIERTLDLSYSALQGELVPTSSPLVFFFPPADGDLPQHAQFRTSLRDDVRFVVIRYPSWQNMIEQKGVFDAIVSAAVSQIDAHQANGPCYLVGYSFGGFVAWEVACRLIRLGRQVAFMGLIDTRRAWDRPSVDLPPEVRRGSMVRIGRFLKATLARPRETISVRWLLPPLVNWRAFRLLRGLGKLAAISHSSVGFEFEFRLAYQLRQQALERWELSSASIPITLFRSGEFDSSLPDYGWGTKSAKVTVIPLGGSHMSLTQTDELSRCFLEVVRKTADTVTPAVWANDGVV
jgi:acyl-CoA synthetase (AMP-forming)/AMP-acid ligase II/thioesterase domain-containing protein/acyl carrier protein